MKKILIAICLILGLLFTNACFAECNKELIYCLKLQEYILDLELALFKNEEVIVQYEQDDDIRLITGKILRKYIESRMAKDGCVYHFPLLVMESNNQIILLESWKIKDIEPVKK